MAEPSTLASLTRPAPSSSYSLQKETTANLQQNETQSQLNTASKCFVYEAAATSTILIARACVAVSLLPPFIGGPRFFQMPRPMMGRVARSPIATRGFLPPPIFPLVSHPAVALVSRPAIAIAWTPVSRSIAILPASPPLRTRRATRRAFGSLAPPAPPLLARAPRLRAARALPVAGLPRARLWHLTGILGAPRRGQSVPGAA